MPAHIRLATPDDAAPMLAIYAPVVRETAISFELDPPSLEEFRGRIEKILKFAPWLACVDGTEVLGYAYAGTFRERAAYRWTVETSIYVHAGHRGRGVGRALYAALLDLLRLQGFCRAVGGATLPNAASVTLHEAMGFKTVGVFPKVGFKFGKWHDVIFWDIELADLGPEPAEPRPVPDRESIAAVLRSRPGPA